MMEDLGFNITKLDVLNYSPKDPPGEIRRYNGYLSIRAKLGINESTEKAAVRISIAVKIQWEHTAQEDLIDIGSIETVAEFAFHDWGKTIVYVDGKARVSDYMERTLVQIAFDSTRGLLRERGKSNLMGQIILPVLNPAILKKQTSIE